MSDMTTLPAPGQPIPLRPLTDLVLAEYAAVIKALGKRVVGDVIEIGARLTECKGICGHGDPLPLPDQEDEKEDAMASPISLRKFQERLDRNCLDEIALLLLALTYGEMIELADAIWSAPEGTAITKENLPALLHRWSKSRSAGRPHDNTGDGG
jgi:hypothetical protein